MKCGIRKVLTALLVAVGLVLIGCQDSLIGPSSKQSSSTKSATSASHLTDCDAIVSGGNSTIQSAVAAASSGDEVCVDGGTYTEQVVINKDLTLRGFGNPTIVSPNDPDDFTIVESGPTWEPIIFAFGGTTATTDGVTDVSGSATVDVSISGFIVDGDDRQPHVKRSVGIFYRNVQSREGITDNTVKNMGVGGRETMGILAYGDTEVTIANNTVSEYERGGIGANGDGGAHPAPEVKITGNTVTGSTGIEEAWAPNGIQVGFGASGQIKDNVVKDNRWSGSGWVASCILIFESNGVDVKDNEVKNCDVGISVGSWSWFLPSADNAKIVENSVDEALAGVVLQAVAGDGFSTSDPSVRNSKVTNNTLTNGLGDTSIGIATDAIDADPDFDPIVANNKLINNVISGFDTAVTDDGSDTKVHANEPATP